MKTLLLAVVLLLVSACAPQGRYPSFDGISGGIPTVIPKMASDAAQHIATLYSPGKDAITINSDGRFAEALTHDLQQKGFAMLPSGVPVTYKLDLLKDEEPKTVYLSVYTPAGNLAKTYTVDGNKSIADRGVAVSVLDSAFVPSSASLPAATVAKTADKPTPEQKTTVATGKAPTPVVPAAQHSAPLATTIASYPAPAPGPAAAWQIQPGLLSPQLKKMAESAGYTLVWRSSNDFDLAVSSAYQGDFINFVQQLFMQLHTQGTPLRVTIFKGNKVIEVVED